MMQKNKFLLVVGLMSIYSLGLWQPLAAQQESSSPTVNDATASDKVVEEITIEQKTTDGQTQESTTQILENLERLAKDSSQSEQIKNQYEGVTSKTRGFIAQVTSLKDDSFKITTPSGEELLIVPDKSTTIVKKGESIRGSDATLTDWVAIDDWLVLIGIQSGETFQPRRILVSSDSLSPVDTFVARGVIKTSQSTKLDIEIIGQENQVETFNLVKNTNLVNADNETITYQDLPAGTPVLLIGTQSGDKKQLQTLRLL